MIVILCGCMPSKTPPKREYQQVTQEIAMQFANECKEMFKDVKDVDLDLLIIGCLIKKFDAYCKDQNDKTDDCKVLIQIK